MDTRLRLTGGCRPGPTVASAQPLFALHDVLQLTLEAEDLETLVRDETLNDPKRFKREIVDGCRKA